MCNNIIRISLPKKISIPSPPDDCDVWIWRRRCFCCRWKCWVNMHYLSTFLIDLLGTSFVVARKAPLNVPIKFKFELVVHIFAIRCGKCWQFAPSSTPRLLGRGRSGYFLFQSSDWMMETYTLLAGVRVHEHWWPLWKPLGWEWGFKKADCVTRFGEI